MKKNLIIILCTVLNCVFSYSQVSPQLSERMPWETDKDVKPVQEWAFYTTWRLELGFQQPNQRSDSPTNNTFLNGGKIGFLVDFNMPYNLGIQTGLRYELTYGTNTQHYRSSDNSNVGVEYIRHQMYKHNLSIPIRGVYTQQLWRELAMTFYTGPTLQIGLAYTDNAMNALSDSTFSWLQHHAPDPKLIQTGKHDYYADKIYNRFNLQWGIGLGLQWCSWRLEGGYNFGLNNLAKYQPDTGKRTNLHEWSWEVSIIYTFNYVPFDPSFDEKTWFEREKRRHERNNKKNTETKWLFGTGFDE